ncbi:MAG TPA: hypothetical protein VHO27_10240 [Angustibacter sp.]|nr:hypothetical protein [Angustibacter sp.]
MISAAHTFDVTSVITAPNELGDRDTRPTLRSTHMQQLMHEDLARAHLNQRLADAERQRLAQYVVRLARARRHANRARRQAEQVQLRLRLLAG